MSLGNYQARTERCAKADVFLPSPGVELLRQINTEHALDTPVPT